MNSDALPASAPTMCQCEVALLITGVALGLGFAPVALAVGPAARANCSGACGPIGSDVDCAAGSGNGPAYVSGPVNVLGDSIYELDRGGNGTGCGNG